MGAGWVTGPQELSPCARHGGPGLASFSFFCCRWEGVSGEAFPTTFWNGLPSPPPPLLHCKQDEFGGSDSFLASHMSVGWW